MLIKNCLLIDGADIFEEKKDIRVENGQFCTLAHTGKGEMPLTGTRKEDGVPNGN